MIKRSTLWIYKGRSAEIKVRGIQNLLNETIGENILNLGKSMDVREKQALKKPQGDTDTKEV